MSVPPPLSVEDVERAVRNARDSIENANSQVRAMIRLAAGRLRDAHRGDMGSWSQTTAALRKMKAELQHFDSRSGRWK